MHSAEKIDLDKEFENVDITIEELERLDKSNKVHKWVYRLLQGLVDENVGSRWDDYVDEV